MRAASVRPLLLRTVHWSLGVADYCTSTYHMREFPWRIDIQLVRALGLTMLANFVVVFSM